MLCANAIFRLAEEDESRNLVRMHGGLEKLVEMMKDDLNKPKAQSNMPVMAAVTGALWKCATNNLENVDRLQVMNNQSFVVFLGPIACVFEHLPSLYRISGLLNCSSRS